MLPAVLVARDWYQLFRICIQAFKDPETQHSGKVNLSANHFPNSPVFYAKWIENGYS